MNTRGPDCGPRWIFTDNEDGETLPRDGELVICKFEEGALWEYLVNFDNVQLVYWSEAEPYSGVICWMRVGKVPETHDDLLALEHQRYAADEHASRTPASVERLAKAYPNIVKE
jgi:hypothetical protein